MHAFKFNTIEEALRRHDPMQVAAIEQARAEVSRAQAFIASMEWLLAAASMWRIDQIARHATLRRQAKRVMHERDVAIRQKLHAERQAAACRDATARRQLEAGVQVHRDTITRKLAVLERIVPEMRAVRDQLAGKTVLS